MDTKRYIDSEKSNSWLDSFLTGTTIEEKQPIVEVKQEPEIDIDPDIEKEISLIQEAKLNQSIKEDVKRVVTVVEEPKKSVPSQKEISFFKNRFLDYNWNLKNNNQININDKNLNSVETQKILLNFSPDYIFTFGC